MKSLFAFVAGVVTTLWVLFRLADWEDEARRMEYW